MKGLTLQVVRDEEGRELGVMLFVPMGLWARLEPLLRALEEPPSSQSLVREGGRLVLRLPEELAPPSRERPKPDKRFTFRLPNLSESEDG
ncbi:hypothetical protein [Thermus sp.]|uniref:hypothetical protein n=1 Tax=Thermus sp. TaxID=275 RepID=UPI0025F9C0A3|nr:hypothetical protein [Thermus sp.]MCS6868363.1 hypothetical protein [Thermus sp.]MDW8356796.1 hypothetical protein [Thermus sp.]